MTAPRMLTVADAAGPTWLACRTPLERQLIASGKLPAVNLSPGKARPTYRIREEDLLAFLAGAAVQPPLPKSRRRKREPAGVTFFPQYRD